MHVRMVSTVTESSKYDNTYFKTKLIFCISACFEGANAESARPEREATVTVFEQQQ